MEELIVKISTTSKDVEILYNNLVMNYQLEKMISLAKFSELINKVIGDERKENAIKPILFDEFIIGYNAVNFEEVYLIKQPEHQRYITYSFDKENGGMKINFPNSVYVVFVNENKIKKIQAFMYDKWMGVNTTLYKYAMPNMLTENRICLGNADIEIHNNKLMDALEKIIYSPYSHNHVNNIKGFKNTLSYFEYLKKNNLNAKYLIPTELIIKDIVEVKNEN